MESIPRQHPRAPQEARAQTLHLHLHANAGVLVDPSTGLHIDHISALQIDLEHIAVPVHPHDSLLALRTGERVDEEAGPAEKHVRDALHALERVLDVVAGREELMLADLDRLS